MIFRLDGLNRLSIINYALRFALGFLVVLCVSVFAWPMLPRHYEAPATIVLLASGRDDDPTATIKQTRQTPDEYETQSEIDLISSPELAATVVAQKQLIEDREFNGSESLYERLRTVPLFRDLLRARSATSASAVRQTLSKRLTVSHDRRSYTVSFGYWSEDPVKAAALSQCLLDAYVELQRSRKRESIDRVTRWLEDRVKRLRDQTARGDEAVERFLGSSGLMDRGADTFLESQLNALSRDYAMTRAQAISDGERAELLTTMRAKGKLEDAPDVIASSTVQKLKENRAVAETQPGRLNSESRASTEQIAAEADHIAAASVVQALLDRQRVAELARTISEVRRSMQERAEARIKLAVLERDAKANRSVLEESLFRLNGQTSLALSIAPDVEVMANPEPPLQAVFPNPMLTALATLMVASVAGTALAFRHHVARGGIIPRFVGVAPNFN